MIYMRKNAFTLIELLAVIVILAIIALIATPIILGIIKDSKDNANKRSIDNYAKAVQNALTKYQLTGKKLEINKLETINGREFNNTDFKVEYEGNIVCDTIEIYEDGNIYLDNCVVNGDNVDYTYGIKRYSDGEIVYFDVKKGESCTNYHVNNSITGYNGYIYKDFSNKEISKLNTQNSCLKFYAFLDNGGKILNLLLDHNTTANSVDWTNTSITTNENGPIDVLNQLKEDTKDWNGTITPENYKYKGSEKEYTVYYNKEEYKYKARLITVQEIAQIIGDDKEPVIWQNDLTPFKGMAYYLDSLSTTESETCKLGNITGCKYGWLYDRTATYCRSYGCLNSAVNASSTNLQTGYWTSSATVYSLFSFAVNYYGMLSSISLNCSDGASSTDCEYGVRPVIEVEKSKL